MAGINKKYPTQCSYFSEEVFSSIGIKKNGRIAREFYHKCLLTEDICKRATNLEMPLFGVKKICVVKKRD